MRRKESLSFVEFSENTNWGQIGANNMQIQVIIFQDFQKGIRLSQVQKFENWCNFSFYINGLSLVGLSIYSVIVKFDQYYIRL